jgi:hypothetical protein
MQSIINYQTSVFGDYMALEPTLERMNSLVNIPAELEITLLPSAANAINIAFPFPAPPGDMGIPQIIQRISMVDKSQHWNIGILPDRIDVNFSQLNAEDAEGLDSISSKAFALIKSTVTNLNVDFWRIAVNVVMQIDEGVESISKVNALYGKLAKPLAHQADKENVEWQVMSNCPQEMAVSENQRELLNVITTVSRQNNFFTSAPLINAHVDVNTSATNRTSRFDEHKHENFNATALEIINNIFEEFKEKWLND